jgi:hypothetical protein
LRAAVWRSAAGELGHASSKRRPGWLAIGQRENPEGGPLSPPKTCFTIDQETPVLRGAARRNVLQFELLSH